MTVIEATRGWRQPREATAFRLRQQVASALGQLRPKWLEANATVRGFVSLFAFQVLLNVLVVAQERAAATAAYAPSFAANLLLAGVTYFAVRQLVASRSAALGVGYALGGGVGGVVGLLATRMLGI
jgi:hypothetical protein